MITITKESAVCIVVAWSLILALAAYVIKRIEENRRD
jgi:hypothetical protein